MSWFFGGGNDKDKSSGSSATHDISSDSTSSGDFSSGSFNESHFSSAPISSSRSSGASLQEQLQIEQQKAMIQTVMLKLTDMSFESCISKPSSSLSSSEVNCINSVVC